MTTGYAWDEAFLGHDPGIAHRERPTRVAHLDTPTVLSEMPGLREVKLDLALAGPGIRRVHDTTYVRSIEDAFAQGRTRIDNADTRVRADTYAVAEAAAAASLSMTRAVMRGEVDNGFVAARPPGHHARASAGRFFCYFNNVAVSARFAQQLGAEKVLIVDWDVHPADGTSSIFWEDPDVYVLSLHQHGIFTETVGTEDQIGRGEGEGATLNVPLPARTDRPGYLRALERGLGTALDAMTPDIVLVSCGFDAHRGDPLGGMALDDEAFYDLTVMLRDAAGPACGGKIVSILEGGYQAEVVTRCARQHLQGLMV